MLNKSNEVVWQFKIVDCSFRNHPVLIGNSIHPNLSEFRKNVEIHVFVGMEVRPFLAVLQGPYSRISVTLLRPHLSCSARPLSWHCPRCFILEIDILDKWNSHKDCNQLYQGSFRSRCYRESMPLENGVRFKESIGFNGIKGGIPQESVRLEVRT